MSSDITTPVMLNVKVQHVSEYILIRPVEFLCYNRLIFEETSTSSNLKKYRVIHFAVSKVNVNKTHITFFFMIFIFYYKV